jgi:signal transduction histidine kinase
MVGQQLDWPEPMSRSFFGRREAILGVPGVSLTNIIQVPVTGVVSIPITSGIGFKAGIRERPPDGPIFIPVAQVPENTVGEGSLIVARVPNNQGGPGGGNFLGSVNTSLILAVIAAGLAAILLTWLLSRRILRPVEALTAAARNMEKGDLSKRVAVSSKDEIGELAHAFNAMADGLTHIEQLRRNMVTDVAHELRTPLTNIRGYLEAVRDGVAKPDYALIDSLHDEALLLSRLVDDLQELELAEAGQLKLVLRSVDLVVVVEKAVQTVRPLASERDLRIETHLAELPAIEADPERIGQVLRNLISNAVTHTPPGGEITVSARNGGRDIEVSVHDTGVGIAAEHLPLVFERFYRADGSRTRSTGGAGLGLSIVKHLVELHGGHVRAESTQGRGSTFIFTLPVQKG